MTPCGEDVNKLVKVELKVWAFNESAMGFYEALA